MKVLVDLSSSQPQGNMKVNGGGESAIVFFKSIVRNKTNADIVEALFNNKLPDNNTVVAWCKENEIKLIRYESIEQLNSIITAGEYNTVVFPVCYHTYSQLNISDSIRVITIIHDLCDIYYYSIPPVKYGKYPNWGRLYWIKKLYERLLAKKRTDQYIDLHNRVLMISNNQIVITVTHYSKASIVKYLNTEHISDIQIVYTPEVHPDIDLSGTNEMDILNHYGLLSGKYFMFMAGCRWAKNNAIALFTLDNMFTNHKYDGLLNGYNVVVLGTDELYKEYFLSHIYNKDRFIFDDYVATDTVETLFKHAHMFVFPSVIEGFGLPPVEAMKYSTVSACSTAMSIPEVCGDSAIYFDPYSEDSIEMAIIKSFDSDYMKVLKDNGRRRYEELKEKRYTDMEKFVNLVWQKETMGA